MQLQAALESRQARVRRIKVLRRERFFIKKGLPTATGFSRCRKNKSGSYILCWCSEEYNENKAYYFNLKNGNVNNNNKNNTNNNDRLAVASLINDVTSWLPGISARQHPYISSPFKGRLGEVSQFLRN